MVQNEFVSYEKNPNMGSHGLPEIFAIQTIKRKYRTSLTILICYLNITFSRFNQNMKTLLIHLPPIHRTKIYLPPLLTIELSRFGMLERQNAQERLMVTKKESGHAFTMAPEIDFSVAPQITPPEFGIPKQGNKLWRSLVTPFS